MDEQDCWTPRLVALASRVDNWAGCGSAMIRWIANRPRHRAFVHPDLVVDCARLSIADGNRVGQVLNQLFLPEEAAALGRCLPKLFRWLPNPVHYGLIEFPLSASEVIALYTPEPREASDSGWLISPHPSTIPRDIVPFRGVVTLWPWSGLEPGDLAPLLALRDRLESRRASALD